MEKGLRAYRVRGTGFCAKAFRVLVVTMGCSLSGSLCGEVGEGAGAGARVSRWWQRLWKLGAVVVTTAGRVWLPLSEPWPWRELWGGVLAAVQSFVRQVLTG